MLFIQNNHIVAVAKISQNHLLLFLYENCSTVLSLFSLLLLQVKSATIITIYMCVTDPLCHRTRDTRVSLRPPCMRDTHVSMRPLALETHMCQCAPLP